jgi:hypothetical protein
MMDDGGAPDDSAPADDGMMPMNDGSTPMDGTMADSGPADTGAGVDSGDGFGAARTACINEINKLRATENKAPYALWTSPAIDMCVDQQATNDEQNKSAHQAWIQGKYPTCNGNGQDECLGYGVTPQGIVKCLDAMWAEKNQSNCSGCPACAGAYNPNCPNCDFYGQKGPECGHYVNMSATWLKKAACGFSALGGWAVQNFSQ